MVSQLTQSMSIKYGEYRRNGLIGNFNDLVKVFIKARKVTVTGTRGSITKNLAHLPIDMKVIDMTKV